jgi:hypothetical protein
MSFEGRVYKSYAASIACLYPEHNLVILNTRDYSRTTGKHQTLLRRAIPGFMRIISGPSDQVSNPGSFAEALMQAALHAHKTATETRRDYPRRKSVIERHETECLFMITLAQETSDVFGLGMLCTVQGIEAMQAEQAKRQAEREARMKLQQEQEEKEARENLRKWLAGEDVPTYRLPGGATYLRILQGPESNVVQTSKGITIPMDEARTSLAFVFSHREHGWHRNGTTFQVVGYHVDSINLEGVVAGCHRITWRELERIQALVSSL